MFWNEEIAESCPDTASEPEDAVTPSYTTEYLTSSLNYFTDIGSGWLGSAWEKAKSTSSIALDTTKRDLKEFVTTIHRDTTQVVQAMGDSAAAITEKIIGFEGYGDKSEYKQFSGVFDSLWQPLHEEQYTPYKQRIKNLQTNLTTYTTDPDEFDDFASWQENFQVDKYTDEISQLLVENQDMKKLHTKLVPSVVSYSIFWMRYFYHAEKLKQVEAIAKAKMNKEYTYDWESASACEFTSGTATPTNSRKSFSPHKTEENTSFCCQVSSQIIPTDIGSYTDSDVESKEGSRSPAENESTVSTDSFVCLEESEIAAENSEASMATKEILQEKMAMASIATENVMHSNESTGDTGSDSIQILDMQDSWVTPLGTPDQERKSLSNSNSPSKHDVITFIKNMTVGKDLHTEEGKQDSKIRSEEWPEWD